MNALAAKYDGWTLDDITAAMGPEGEFDWNSYIPTEGYIYNCTEEVDELRQYLSLISKGELTSDVISMDNARQYLQSQLDKLLMECTNSQGMAEVDFGKFPLDGLSLESDLNYANLSECTGLTSAQLASISSMLYSTLPSVEFEGAEVFNGYYSSVDFSNCTGITVEQFLTGNLCNLSNKMPAITFTGSEDFSHLSLDSVDLSKCMRVE